MKRSRLSEEQIIGILKEHQAGMSAVDLCRKYGFSDLCSDLGHIPLWVALGASADFLDPVSDARHMRIDLKRLFPDLHSRRLVADGDNYQEMAFRTPLICQNRKCRAIGENNSSENGVILYSLADCEDHMGNVGLCGSGA